ncbi:MAG: biotin/lipoyl-binding protein [Clostridiales bacterium]|jgi:biotin carboxyl carrier protein|nr:biotin/lipoyl-binding protein [Clostridiales bacterium]
MKNYKITINGKTYDVTVEECDSGAQVKSVRQEAPAPIPAPVPKPAPAPAPAPAPGPAPAAEKSKAGSGDVTAPLGGTVLSVAVSEGDRVKAGQVLLVFEAMKMENELVAPFDGTVKKVFVSKGSVIETGMVVVSLE